MHYLDLHQKPLSVLSFYLRNQFHFRDQNRHQIHLGYIHQALKMQKLFIFRVAIVNFLCFFIAFSVEAMEPSSSLQKIFDQLKNSAAPEVHQQIVTSILISDTLLDDLNHLSESGKFSGFIVRDKNLIQDLKAGMFGGFVDNSELILTTEFVKELEASRIYNPVGPDYIAPNTTVFALAHLTYHIKSPFDVRKSTSLEASVSGRTRTEAEAYIYAWNAMLMAAEQKNGGKILTNSQVIQLLMNFRYKFAFIKAVKQIPAPLKFSDGGKLESNVNNIESMMTSLISSPIIDLE